MADDQVSGEFRFDLTGNGIKKLESLTALLETVNKISLIAVRRTNSLSTSINREAVAVRSATAAYRLYTNAINRAAKAHLDLKKAAGGTPAAPTAATTATAVSPTVTPTGKSAAAIATAEEKALNAQIKKSIADAEKLNKAYYANQRREAAETARAQKQISSEASAYLAKEDAKRAASAKSAAASEAASAKAAEAEIQKAASTAVRQAEGITRQHAKEVQAAIRADQQWAAGLSNTRYALYDVSRTATVAAIAMGASVAIPIYMAAKYEKAFASVARTVGTTGEATSELRTQFEDLATAIPESFDNLAKIGTLAGQLDIPAASVAEFTKVVAQFSATTNVGVEEAATNLGRVAQLTGTASTQYANLGSAIYEVGVTSVATESEILDMSSQIATAGDLAGFSNIQIIALSGALASLGVQPEAARGSLQRIFNIIENGATSSTKATQQLADATGMTIEQMKALWKSGDTGSQEVFSAFVEGLGRMQEAGQSTTNFLRDMGVNAVRDQRLLQVLANNTDVYAQALTNSASAYQNGTNLADAYNKQTDNVADNLTRLINTLAAFVAELGQSDGMLSNIIKGITDVGKMWLNLSRNPILGTITKLVGGLLVVGTVMALSVAITSKLRGAMYGLVTSSIGVKATSDSLTTSFGVLSKELAVTAKQFLSGTLTAETFGNTIGRTAASTNVLTASLTKEGAAAAGASGASSVMALNVLKGIASFAKFTIIIGAVTTALDFLNTAWTEATATPLDKANKIFGDAGTGLAEALKADAEEYAKSGTAIRVYTDNVNAATQELPAWQIELDNARKGQGELGTAVSGTTKEIEKQRQIVIGQNAAQEFRNLVAGADSVKKAWKDYGDTLTKTGFNLDDFFAKVGTSADHGISDLKKKLAEAEHEANIRSIVNVRTPENDARKKELEGEIQAYRALIAAVQALDPKLQEATIAQQLNAAATKKSAQAAELNKNAFADLGDATTTLSQSFANIRDSVMAPYEAAQSWRALGEAIAKNGKDFDGLGEKAQANVSAVVDVLDQMQQAAGEDSTAFGQSVLGMMKALQKQGINTGGSLSFLGDILNKTLGGTYNLDFNSSEAQANIVGVIDAAIVAQQAIMSLQASAIGAAQSALQAGYSVANASALFAAQAAYDAAAAKAASLEALRALAVKASAAAQHNLTQGLNDGTKALHKNSGAANKNAAANKKAARTIRDWVSDLREVMGVADEFRFGLSDAWQKVQEAQDAAIKQMIDSVWNISAAYDQAFRTIDFKDSLTSALYDMQHQAEDAASSVTDAINQIMAAQAELAGIGSDRTNLTYGLSVAVMYGDALREQSIRAKLTELDAKEAAANKDLADSQKDLQKARDSQNKSLVGNSEQAIANRKTVQDLVGTYSDYIKKLADSGMSTEDIAAAVAQAQQDFLAQAEAMGFAANELDTYAALFNKFAATTTTSAADGEAAVRDLYDAWQEYILQLIQSGASQKEINAAIEAGKKAVNDLAVQMGLAPSIIAKYIAAFNGMDKIIDKIPKNITTKIDADLDPADKAIADWRAKNTGGKGASRGINVPVDVAYSGGKSSEREHAEEMMSKYAKLIMGTSNMAALTEYSKKWTYWQRQSLKSLWTGGFTGRGNKYDEAGVVHKGEYVVPKKDVNQSTGLPFIMERVQNSNTTNNTSRMPSVIMVELSPTDRALLKASGGDLIVQIDGKQVAAAVNGSNKNSSVRGSN